MVSRAQDERVFGEAGAIERGEHLPDCVVEPRHHRAEAGHIRAQLRRIRIAGKSRPCFRRVFRSRRWKRTVCFKKANREKKWLPAGLVALEKPGRGARGLPGVIAGAPGDLVDLVVHERARPLVLNAAEHGLVAVVAQVPDQVTVEVADAKLPAVGQADQAVGVRVLSRQHRAAARGARRARAERIAEQNALSGEPHQIRRRNRGAARLNQAPGIMRVDIEDIQWLHWFPFGCGRAPSARLKCALPALTGPRDQIESSWKIRYVEMKPRLHRSLTAEGPSGHDISSA